MGILHRFGMAINGGWDALKAPVGLVSDLVTAPVKNDDVDGIVGSLNHIVAKRTGEFLGGAFGPEGVIGAPTGGLPEGVRQPVRAVVQPILRGADSLYREAVSRPLSTAILTGSLSSAPGGGGNAGLFSGDNWREAYRESKFTSPGQALGYAILTEDITDPDQLAKAQGSDWFQMISGSTDALSRFFLDPTVIGGKPVKVARSGEVARDLSNGQRVWVPNVISTPAQRELYVGSSRYADFQQKTLGKSAPEIRDTYFKDNEHGAVISTLLADARNESEHRNVTLALMGDAKAKQVLKDENIALNNALDRAVGQRDIVSDRLGTLFEQEDDLPYLASVQDEIDQLYGSVAARSNITNQGGSAGFVPIRQSPSFSALQSAKRSFVTGTTEAPDGAGRLRETLYQKNPLSMVLRKATTWQPGGTQGMVRLHDPASDVQLQRFMKKSAIDQDTQIALLDKYMRTGDEFSRQVVWHEAESLAVKRLAESKGISVEGVDALVQAAKNGRSKVDSLANVKGRVYDGEGKSRIRYKDDDSGQMIDIPLLVSQNQNIHTVVNLDELNKVVSDIGQYMGRHPHVKQLADVPTMLLDSYMHFWKPTTLLRLGWPIRVVMDEQLRIMAKIGTLAHANSLKTAFSNAASDVFNRVDKDLRVPGQRTFDYRDYGLPSGFGGMPGDAKNIFVGLNRARDSFDSLYGHGDSELAKLRKSGQWRSIAPDGDDAASYGPAWEHAINKQIGQDEMARWFLRGADVDQVVDWLRQTQEGRAYAARNKMRQRSPKKWAADVEDQVRRYTADSPDIKAAALSKTAKFKDLTDLIQDLAARPVIHGEILDQAMGKGISQIWSKIVEKGYETLGEKPSSFLSRNPFFDHVYRDEMKRLVDLTDATHLTQETIDEMAHNARLHALSETKKLLYDLGERSDLEQTLRFFVPFYGAWQEVLTRWSGLAVENPVFMARMDLIWNSPEKAGIVTDEKGNQVFEDGSALDPLGNSVEAGKARYINMPLPSTLKHVPFFGQGIESKAGFSFNKKSLNLLMQGPPGFGPIVQVPVNQIVKENPSLEDSLKFILPFGTSQSTLDLIIPTGLKRLKEQGEGEDNRTFRNMTMRIYWDKLTDFQLGKRSKEPTFDEALSESKKLAALRTVSAYTLPFQATYKSPYQPYIDALRAARERLAQDPNALGTHVDGTPKTADEWFYDTYGSEYFALSQSVSRSMDGVPPTKEGLVSRKQHKDLIEKYPKFGGLIVGKEGAGEFSASVYDAQFANNLKPGSDIPQRDSPSFDESQASYESRLGWMEYGKIMDLIEAERVQRQLPNLSRKGAKDLLQLKQNFVQSLATKYPGWGQDYFTFDAKAGEENIQALTAIANDSTLSKRQDIEGLNQYLQLRSQIVGELNKKGTTLEKDRALADSWESLKGELVESNLSFASLYYRWLDRDQPARDAGVAVKKKAKVLV